MTQISLNSSKNQNLRVLHLLMEAGPGGLSRYVIDLATAMAPHGVQSIVAADDGSLRNQFDAAPLQFIQIPLLKERFLFRACRSIIHDTIGDQPIDIIHTHYRRATLLARKLRLNRPAGGRPPILYTVHLSHITMRFPLNLLTDFGDYTHIASEDSRTWCVEEGVSPERIYYIPHGIRTERFVPADAATKSTARHQLQLEDGDLVAAFVGRLDYPKNESWLLDLAAASKAELPNLRIVLAGDGPHMAAVRHRIDAENLHDRVRVLGECDPLPVYQAADALLLPSLREGFSLVCAEAMSCGVPVLRTRTTGTKELILEGVTGNSTSIDQQAFIAAAMKFLANKQKLHEMGATAAAHVRQHFDYGQQVSQTLDLYNRLITIHS